MPVYVYAVTAAGHVPDVADATGVGAPPAGLRVIRGDGVAAVVSDAPEAVRPKRRDLKAHQEVLEGLQRSCPLLPMRFGLLAADDDEVRRTLNERQEEFLERLRAIGDGVEFHVRAAQDEETGLRAALAGSGDVRRLAEATRGGGSYEDRLALGEAAAAELQQRQHGYSERLLGALRPLARAEAPGTPTGDAFLAVSFLVDRGRAAAFGTAVDRAAEELGSEIELRLYGPLPPYSFVAGAGEPEAARWAS
jgi:hypothetical protein